MTDTDRLMWINEDSTVFVERWPNSDGKGVNVDSVYVATRPNSDSTWGPPIECKPDRDTQKTLDSEGNSA